MLKKLTPVIAAPAIWAGIKSLICGYISNPEAEKKPKAKKAKTTTVRLASGGMNIKPKTIAARTPRQQTIIHFWVFKI